MDHKLLQKKTRTSYFGNVKNRLGPKLPAGVSQPPQFTMRTWEVQPQVPAMQQPTLSGEKKQQPISARPLTHTPYIRNPKLRQYYLQGTPWEVGRTDVANYMAHSGDTVFSVSSQFCGPSQPSSSETLIPRELLVVPKEKAVSGTQEATELKTSTPSNLDTKPKQELRANLEPVDPTAQPQSPSPEAEYDKLLDVEAVPLPNGQLCLLALPPECCESEGADGTSYLKLFCRYITDCKGVVSGILLVTSNKLFFDPCKTHPLVKENGCEEYVLSCSMDSLASVSFYSDITHVHFSSSEQRRKGRTLFQKLKRTKRQANLHPSHVDDAGLASAALFEGSDGTSTDDVCDDDEDQHSRDMTEVEKELDCGLLDDLYEPAAATVLNSTAAFCCGGPQATSQHTSEEVTAAGEQSPECGRPSASRPGRLMFVRLRAQLPTGRRKGVGSGKTLPRRDTWLALSQESSDELYAYLTHCRPDLCLLEGDQEGEEDEFVLVEDKEQESEEEEDGFLQRQHSSGGDWEIVLMEDNREKPILVIDREPEGLQSIVERSQVLKDSYVRELCKELPPRTVGHNWKLTYSTSSHGSSLKSLYRKVSASDSPALIVIKDAHDEVFGAFLSHPLRPSETFYGTGETFLFMLHPRFKCFRWTGENSFFIKGDLDSFAIGGGSGHFGLWVDENLYLGRSRPCFTFNNCCLSETDDFRIVELEVWTFS